MESHTEKDHRNRKRRKILVLLTALVVLLLFASILLGFAKTGPRTLWYAYTAFDGSMDHLILRTTRVPRALIAMSVGASLGVSGLLMQTLTRNPMASPSLFGVNAGASFFLVAFMSFLPGVSQQHLVAASMLGASLAAAGVYLLAGGFGGDPKPVHLTLAGAAVTFLFLSLTQGILVVDQTTLEETLFWLSGAIEGRKLEHLLMVLPLMVAGMTLAITMSDKLNLFALGEETAMGLGLKVQRLKAIMALATILMAAASVSVAGPIGLIGLLTPHLVRRFSTADFRWTIPYAALTGSALLLVSDILARFLIYPAEAPVGAVTALLGAPLFLHIARRVEQT